MMKLAALALLFATSTNAFMGTKLNTFGMRRSTSLNMVAEDAKVVLITGSSQGKIERPMISIIICLTKSRDVFAFSVSYSWGKQVNSIICRKIFNGLVTQ